MWSITPNHWLKRCSMPEFFGTIISVWRQTWQKTSKIQILLNMINYCFGDGHP